MALVIDSICNNFHFPRFNVTNTSSNNVKTIRTLFIFLSGTRKNYNFVYGYQGSCHLTCLSTIFIAIATSLLHTSMQKTFCETKEAIARRKTGFTAIFFGILYLPIYTIRVQCGKYCCIMKRLDTFVHAWYLVRVPDCHYVQHLIGNAKSKSSVSLRDKINLLCPLSLSRLSNVHGKHSIYLLIFEFSSVCACSVSGWLYRFSIGLLNLKSVLYHVNQTKGAFPLSFELC